VKQTLRSQRGKSGESGGFPLDRADAPRESSGTPAQAARGGDGETGRMIRRSSARWAIAAAAFACLWFGAPRAHAYPSYNDGLGGNCASLMCRPGFLGGNGPLHLQHRNNFNVKTCNLCHPNGGGTTPVLTYFSGPGGGRGCAGCHGLDYGETSPNSGQPKST